MVRAAVYARISQKDESFDKVESQIDRCLDFAEAQKYDVDPEHVFDDDGISGWSGKNRPGFLNLLALISSKERPVDVVVAVAQDRLSRNESDWLAVKGACAKADILIHTINGGKVDMKDPMSVAIAGMLQVLADMESANKSQKISDRIVLERSLGKPLWGRVPFGYLDRMTLDPTTAPHIVEAYKTILDGGTTYGIAKDWNSLGLVTTTGKPWKSAAVGDVLLRPRNAGLIENEGEILPVEGTWEKIVERPTWEAVRLILTKPERRRTGEVGVSWLLSGIARCGTCGRVMRSASSTERRTKERILVYRCSSKTDQLPSDGLRHVTARREELDALVAEEVAFTFRAAGQFVVPQNAATARREVVEVELARIRESRSNLLGLAQLPGFNITSVRPDIEKMAKQQTALEAERDTLAAQDASSAMFIGSLASMEGAPSSQDFLERFQGLPVEQQRTLVRRLLTVTVHPGVGTHRFEVEQTWLNANAITSTVSEEATEHYPSSMTR